MHENYEPSQKFKNARDRLFALALLILGSILCFHYLFNGAFMQAVEAGNVARVRNLLAIGADANTVGWPSSKNGLLYLIDRCDHPEFYTERTALMLAATEDNTAVVQLLLEHGADVHASAYNHTMTALTCAATSARLDTVRLLLTHGAGRSPQEWSAALVEAAGGFAMMEQNKAQYREIVLVLLQHGADINRADTNGNYALTFAVQTNGDSQTIRFLLQQGADPNVKDWGGTTPLQYATRNNNPAICRMLKAAGERE